MTPVTPQVCSICGAAPETVEFGESNIPQTLDIQVNSNYI
jgi:hypothetical protein